MTIGKGQVWGQPGPLPDDGVLVRTDAEASAAIAVARADGTALPILGLVGGDLARTCGATGDEDRLRGSDAQRLPVDLGIVAIDGVEVPFVAHVVVRRRTWLGPIVVAMNAQFIGRADVAPRSHPNDGRLDVLAADLALGQRWEARRRLATGTHVPHPGVRERRVRDAELPVARGAEVWVDGVRRGRPARVEVRIEPDALTVVV